jgi:RNA polymerase sigma-70 factor (ECF subfamily)
VSSPEKELAIVLHNSNEAVFENIFRNYYERLCNYANTMTNDMDEAEEIVQNTFLILWEKRMGIDIHTSLKSYLYQTVHNTCLNRIKHNRVVQMHNEHVRSTTENTTPSGSDQLIGKELETQVNSAIQSLPPQCQAVFKLSRFENLTYAEISEQLNISVKTVENHMGKALRIMRDKLKDYLPLVLFWIFFRNN